MSCRCSEYLFLLFEEAYRQARESVGCIHTIYCCCFVLARDWYGISLLRWRVYIVFMYMQHRKALLRYQPTSCGHPTAQKKITRRIHIVQTEYQLAAKFSNAKQGEKKRIKFTAKIRQQNTRRGGVHEKSRYSHQ